MHPNGNGKHTSSGKPRKLLDQVRDRVRTKHYSIRTKEAYVGWIRRFVLFHNKRHPREMGKREIESFLTYLAVDSKVSSSTQSQALSALLFLYRDVLDLEFPQIEDVIRGPGRRNDRSENPTGIISSDYQVRRIVGLSNELDNLR